MLSSVGGKSEASVKIRPSKLKVADDQDQTIHSDSLDSNPPKHGECTTKFVSARSSLKKIEKPK